MKAIEVYKGSDGSVTLAYYMELQKRGPIGQVALNLFRAQKCSGRAKVYRGRRFKDAAYGRKQWSMGLLTRILGQHAEGLGIRYGWKEHPEVVFGDRPSFVLYVDLPQLGQVSFHSPTRGEGPDYPGEFDGEHKSEERILAFCDSVWELEAVAA